MPNIVIHHVSGTKANQREDVPLQGFRELLIGREANAHIRFDADREDLVSRNHARIVRDPADPNGFLLMDLDSRNGTFINRQRIYGASRLQHGDRVQLGPAGPEFVFELDPPPLARATRLADATAAPPTREAAVAAGLGPTGVPPGLSGATPMMDAPRPVGRATVERMLGEVTSQMKGESRRTMWAAVIGILVVLVAGSGYFLWDRQQAAINREKERLARMEIENQLKGAQLKEQQILAAIQTSQRDGKSSELAKLKSDLAEAQKEKARLLTEKAKSGGPGDGGGNTPGTAAAAVATSGAAGTNPADLTPEQIHAASAKSVILIQTAWKIADTETGGQLYIASLQNSKPFCPEVADRSEYLPMFVEDDSKKMYPVLSTLPNDGHNAPITATISGSGFIVGGEGYFLTNRHVLGPWRANWNTADFVKKPVGIKVKNGSIVGCISADEFPSRWVPTEGSPMVIDQKDADKFRYSGRLDHKPLHTDIQGEAAYYVTFARTMQRYRAISVTLSERHDVALGKVDVPGGGAAVTMFADQSAIHPGQQVVVLGYPSVSPSVFGVDVSRDLLTRGTQISEIADPTLTTGPISKVVASGGPARGADDTISLGEVYQLGINTTGSGNSGGPVFDSKGRVIAIFYAGVSRGGATVTYAVPIKYGKELIDNPSALR
jgi:S1-C subfamily serine protease